MTQSQTCKTSPLIAQSSLGRKKWEDDSPGIPWLLLPAQWDKEKWPWEKRPSWEYIKLHKLVSLMLNMEPFLPANTVGFNVWFYLFWRKVLLEWTRWIMTFNQGWSSDSWLLVLFLMLCIIKQQHSLFCSLEQLFSHSRDQFTWQWWELGTEPGLAFVSTRTLKGHWRFASRAFHVTDCTNVSLSPSPMLIGWVSLMTMSGETQTHTHTNTNTCHTLWPPSSTLSTVLSKWRLNRRAENHSILHFLERQPESIFASRGQHIWGLFWLL